MAETNMLCNGQVRVLTSTLTMRTSYAQKQEMVVQVTAA